MPLYWGKMLPGILGEGRWRWSCQERWNGEGLQGGLWIRWERTWRQWKWRGKTRRREQNGDGESTVATPNGSSRKKRILISIFPFINRLQQDLFTIHWPTMIQTVQTNHSITTTGPRLLIRCKDSLPHVCSLLWWWGGEQLAGWLAILPG